MALDGGALGGDHRRQVRVDLASLQAEGGEPSGIDRREPEPPQHYDQAQARQIGGIELAIAVDEARRGRQNALLLIEPDGRRGHSGTSGELGDLHGHTLYLQAT